MPMPCFWVDVSDEVELQLRRYVSSAASGKPACPSGYHEAVVSIGRGPAVRDERGYYSALHREDFADGPWPTHCGWLCGYEFVEDDVWQVAQQRVFVAGDGREWDERHLPPGAMLDGFWHPQKGPDGLALVVVLPPAADDTRGHWWHVDGPSRNNGVAGPGWTRTGDPRAVPPTVAAQPSILTGDYHGYLTVVDGVTVLTDHLG